MGIEKWSTTAGSNNMAVPEGWPEGMAPSNINNCGRDNMASVKEWQIDAEWLKLGANGSANAYSISFVSATSFKFVGTDRRTLCPVNRRVKAGVGAGTIYGTVTDSSLSASDTQITVAWDSGTLDSSLSFVSLGILNPSNPSFPANADSSFSDVSIAGTLSVNGDTSLSDVRVTGDASLSDVWVAGTLSVAGDSSLSDVTVTGNISLSAVSVAAAMTFGTSGTIAGNPDATLSDVTVAGTLDIRGAVSLSASMQSLALRVLADTSLSDVFVAGALQGLGDTSLSDVWITGSLQALADTSLSDVFVGGTLDVDGAASFSASVQTLALRVLADASLSDAFVAGTLDVAGAAGLDGDTSLSDVFISGGVRALQDTSLSDVSIAGLLTIAGQIGFPATANASADVNTLDDYEEGTWTPVVTFATPGNLSVTYTTQTGFYRKVGALVTIWANINTATFTHTSASGVLQVTGANFAHLTTVGGKSVGPLQWEGITKANYTHVVAELQSASQTVIFRAMGSGQAASTIEFGDTPTGGNLELYFSITYPVAT